MVSGKKGHSSYCQTYFFVILNEVKDIELVEKTRIIRSAQNDKIS